MSEAISMISFMGGADRVRQRIEATANFLLLMTIEPGALALLGLLRKKHLTPAVAFPVMLSLQVPVRFVNGLFHMVGYSRQAHVIRHEIRARFTGISGLLGPWVPILVRLVAAKILKLMGFPQVVGHVLPVQGLLCDKAGGFSPAG